MTTYNSNLVKQVFLTNRIKDLFSARARGQLRYVNGVRHRSRAQTQLGRYRLVYIDRTIELDPVPQSKAKKRVIHCLYSSVALLFTLKCEIATSGRHIRHAETRGSYVSGILKYCAHIVR